MTQMNLTVAMPEGIETEAKKILHVALAYRIDSAMMYAHAAEELQTIKGKAAMLEAKRKEIVDPLNKVVKTVNDLFRQPAAFYSQAEQALKAGMIAYDDEQERLRKAEQERLQREQEAARRKAEEDAERARQTAAAAAAVAAQATTPEELEAAVEQVAAAIAETENAEAQQAALSVAPTPIVAATVPKVAGIARKSTWRGECTSFACLVIAVAADLLLKSGKAAVAAATTPTDKLRAEQALLQARDLAESFGVAPITLLELNQSALSKTASAQKDAMNIPGCRAVEEKGIASSRR